MLEEVQEISLMSHYLWNSSLVMAEYIQEEKFQMANKTVLELGSGAGLPGILAAKMGASVCLSDYPDPVITANLAHNVNENFHDPARCKVVPHAWGTDVKDLLESNSGALFDVILLSDVVWISDQHKNLLETCTKTLCSHGRVYLTCGVHSGWQCVERFLQLAHDSFGLAHNLVERRTHQSWGAHAAEAIDDIALRNRTIFVYEFWYNR
ncbi:hypothetical protein K450DRAFT_231384 [Umbelopsis ramanniana AG]|uniref:Uncharacterized protein n=1 Tax=Umbelopsis ramanniana AG TaxID=1314678 RepID=A0AAD5HGJ7_UMBRA|nr:uncharacterized protein K450DRAFT_231384 [Umbelopsis ramanniana AG]KAI8581836.1 hypothetical protein K450DRAFT_231384 [Umbelopsis ramanniana AG]